MDSSLKKIVVAFGIIVVLLGALLTWRGISVAIPVMGVLNGSVYVIAGIFFVILGLLILFLPPYLRHRKAKKEKQAERIRAQIEKELKR